MKHFIIVNVFLLFLVRSNCQSSTVIDYSKGICECLDSLNKTGDVETNFIPCLRLSVDRHLPEFILEVTKRYGDSTAENMTKFIEVLEIEVSIKLINSCTPYFMFTDSLKHQQYKNINRDSINKLLKKVESVSNTNRNKRYYECTSSLYFQLGNYDKAMENVEKILSEDSADIMALFIKASVMDSKKNYREAIILYDKAAELSHQNAFYLYSAIARRKMNGL